MATFFPHFRLANHMGLHEVKWSVSSVHDLIEQGTKEFGSVFAEEIKLATILVNGRAVAYLKGPDTPLGENDEVWTVLPSAGG